MRNTGTSAGAPSAARRGNGAVGLLPGIAGPGKTPAQGAGRRAQGAGRRAQGAGRSRVSHAREVDFGACGVNRRPSSGRKSPRTRLALLLPVLALLLGALPATPAVAQTVWSTTLTVDEAAGLLGCDDLFPSPDDCRIALTDNEITHGGSTYTVARLYRNRSTGNLTFRLTGLTGLQHKSALAGLTLLVDGVPFAVNDATPQSRSIYWPMPGQGWTDGQRVSLRLTATKFIYGLELSGFQVSDVNDESLKLSWEVSYVTSEYRCGFLIEWRKQGETEWRSEKYYYQGYRPSFTIGYLQSGTDYDVRVSVLGPPGEPDVEVYKNEVKTTGEPPGMDQRGNPPEKSEPPAVSSARVDGTALTLAFDADLDASAVPPGSAFVVKSAVEHAVTAVAVSGSEATLTLSPAVAADDAVTIDYVPPGSESARLRLAGGGPEVERFNGQAVANETAPGDRPEPPQPLTARVAEAPADHDGNRFAVDIEFSEEVRTKPQDASGLSVSGGTVARARRADGRKDRWRITVEPDSHAAVTVTLSSPSDCVSAGAVCTADGRALTGSATATVAGPPGLSVADARVDEGRRAKVSFAVTLSRASTRKVRVRYATADGSARAGEDYREKSGRLTFQPGQTSKTVAVKVLDDAVDEGEETFTLTLSDASGAYLADAEATGTIANSDPLPAAWLARFGRAATDHVVDALDARFEDAGRGSGREANLGGFDLFGPRAGGAWDADRGARGAFPAAPGPRGDMPPAPGGGHAVGTHGVGWPAADAGMGGRSAYGGRGGALGDLLPGSSFRASWGDAESGRRLTAWGRAAASYFAGDADGVAVDGDAATVMLGADAAWSRWLAGVALARTTGSGSYAGDADGGVLSGTLTAVHPYARFEATERLSLWGALGWGGGALELRTDAGGAWRTPTSMGMAAGGLRGVLLRGAGGLEVAGRMDARFTRMASEAAAGDAGNLAAASGDAGRLRLLLEGSRPFALGARRTLTPGLEIGLRRDAGDAETGAGVELGGSLRYLDERLGLSVDLAGRRLAAHADGSYEEWGAGASVRIDPGASGRGLALEIAPAWGAEAAGGAERLWSMADARGLALGRTDAGMRLGADVSYGLDAFGGRGDAAPYVGMARSAFGADWRAGVRWTVGVATEFGFEATRQEFGDDAAVHGVRLRFAWRPGADPGAAVRVRDAAAPRTTGSAHCAESPAANGGTACGARPR